jgi:Na+-translocating ferredoxin:NAD+ oxidoreductase RnfE subunit
VRLFFKSHVPSHYQTLLEAFPLLAASVPLAMANQTIAILRRNQPQTLRVPLIGLLTCYSQDPDLYRANSAYAPEDWESYVT